MILPHFSLRQVGQRFLSSLLLSTLINSAAPVSLYCCKHVEWGALNKSWTCLSWIRFTLSCPGYKVLNSWAPPLGFLSQVGSLWSRVRPRLGTRRTKLQASSGGRRWGTDLQAFLWEAWCHRRQEVGTRLFSACYLILQEWCLWRWNKAGSENFDSSWFCLFLLGAWRTNHWTSWSLFVFTCKMGIVMTAKWGGKCNRETFRFWCPIGWIGPLIIRCVDICFHLWS